MTQKDKKLLLCDLSARLPYGVKVTWDNKHPLTVTPHIYCAIANEDNKDKLPKIFLRPMSSMTDEEYEEYYNISYGMNNIGSKYKYYDLCDWFNKHHFDYRDLIEKGLALEAPEGMY